MVRAVVQASCPGQLRQLLFSQLIIPNGFMNGYLKSSSFCGRQWNAKLVGKSPTPCMEFLGTVCDCVKVCQQFGSPMKHHKLN